MQNIKFYEKTQPKFILGLNRYFNGKHKILLLN